MPSFSFNLLKVSGKKNFEFFYENLPFMSPHQPIKLSDLDKSHMKHGGLVKKYIPSKKSSAQVGVWVNSVLTRNGYIKCYTSLFKEIILQQCDAFQTEIQNSLTKPCVFKASRGHPSKMVKLPIISPGAKNMEYLNTP